MKRENSNNRTWIFEEAPIAQAVFTMAIPTIITQLINIVYNFADAWYVGRTGSAAMMAALSVSLPIFIIIQALANLFGIGGASAISRALGRKEVTRARKIFAFSLYGGLMAAVIYGITVFFSRPLMIPLIGGSEDSYRYVYDYMFWTMVVGADTWCALSARRKRRDSACQWAESSISFWILCLCSCCSRAAWK